VHHTSQLGHSAELEGSQHSLVKKILQKVSLIENNTTHHLSMLSMVLDWYRLGQQWYQSGTDSDFMATKQKTESPLS
jgi:DNA phosphorothioation-dependent restriction protein DptG